MRLQFETVDVFTAEQFSGNPLAVVLNAEGLSAAQMQAIAGEFNLSETTFVLPPQDPAHTAQVRIFTPNGELPFAGHPNVGTAFVLACIGQSYGRSVAGDRMVFEEKAGLVPIELIKDGDAITGARLTSPQALSVTDEIAPDVIAAACSLSAGDIEIANHRPCIASCGAAFIVAEVNNRAALIAASPRADVFGAHIAGYSTSKILLYVPAGEGTVEQEPRRPGHRQRQCRADRPVGEAAPGNRSDAVEDHPAGLRDGPAEPAVRQRREARWRGHHDRDRRPLRGGDVGNDRPEIGSESRTGARSLASQTADALNTLPDRDRRSSTDRRRS